MSARVRLCTHSCEAAASNSRKSGDKSLEHCRPATQRQQLASVIPALHHTSAEVRHLRSLSCETGPSLMQPGLTYTEYGASSRPVLLSEMYRRVLNLPAPARQPPCTNKRGRQGKGLVAEGVCLDVAQGSFVDVKDHGQTSRRIDVSTANRAAAAAISGRRGEIESGARFSNSLFHIFVVRAILLKQSARSNYARSYSLEEPAWRS